MDILRNNLLWDLSAIYLGTVALVAALAKIFERNGSDKGIKNGVEKVFGVTLLVTSALLVLSRSTFVLVVSGAVVTLVSLVGEILRIRGGVYHNCNCFGSMTPKNQLVMSLITLMSVLAFACLFLNYTVQSYVRRDLHLLILSIIIALIAIFKMIYSTYINSFDIVMSNRMKGCDGEFHKRLDAEIILGKRLGVEVTMGKVDMREFSAILIIGISATCRACRRVYDYYASVSESFPEDVKVIFLSKTKVRYVNEVNKTINIVDKNMNVAKNLCIPKTPFAVLLDKDCSFVADPSLGLNRVISLLDLVTKIS